MRPTVLVFVLFLAACPRDKDEPPPAQGSGSGSSCDTSELRDWLLALAADGHAWPQARPRLGTIDRVPNGYRPLGPAAVIGDDHVSIDGTILAESRTLTSETVRTYLAALRTTVTTAPITLVIDERAPWSAVAAVQQGAAAAGYAKLDILLRATRPGRAAAPGPSSIDAALTALRNNPSSEPPRDFPREVFARCPAAIDWLPSLATLDVTARDRAVIEQLPGKVAACACKVELAAAQRLLWSWWERDAPQAPSYTLSVPLDPAHGRGVGGPAGETWGNVAPAIVTAAQEGAAVRFEVR